MSLKYLKKQKLYWIEFYDHGINLKDECVCQVVGWLVEDRDKSYLISPWRLIADTIEDVEANYEHFVILKSTIIRKKLLRV